MRAIGCLKSILCTVLGVYIWYCYTLGKRVQAYVLVYCPLGQRLVNVCMGGPRRLSLLKIGVYVPGYLPQHTSSLKIGAYILYYLAYVWSKMGRVWVCH
jgi:hypothetical protein